MEYYEGLKIGKLTLLKIVGRDKWSKRIWLCKCDCGNVVERNENNLKQSMNKGKTPHCGCSPNWKGTNKRFNDLSGERFGRLTVLNFHGKDKHSHNYWTCKCDCGNVCIVSTNSLETKRASSCGCLKKENNINTWTTHGKVHDRLYRTYNHMISRCHKDSDKSYNHYGGRGIFVCKEWKDDFMSFYNWAINHGYSKNLTIERIDVNGNYEPSNCRWATTKEQGVNKRTNINIEHDGRTLNLSEWAAVLGVTYSYLYYRVIVKNRSLISVINEIK